MKRGPKPLPREKRKCVPLGLRVTPALRRAMDKAAAESGRSLAAEVEFRLEVAELFLSGKMAKAVGFLGLLTPEQMDAARRGCKDE